MLSFEEGRVGEERGALHSSPEQFTDRRERSGCFMRAELVRGWESVAPAPWPGAPASRIYRISGEGPTPAVVAVRGALRRGRPHEGGARAEAREEEPCGRRKRGAGGSWRGDNTGIDITMEEINLSIGRIPVKNMEESQKVYNKLVTYINQKPTKSLWKNKAVACSRG